MCAFLVLLLPCSCSDPNRMSLMLGPVATFCRLLSGALCWPQLVGVSFLWRPLLAVVGRSLFSLAPSAGRGW